MTKPNPPAAEKSKFVSKGSFQRTFNLFCKVTFIKLFILLACTCSLLDSEWGGGYGAHL
jgi:hypothetical protein